MIVLEQLLCETTGLPKCTSGIEKHSPSFPNPRCSMYGIFTYICHTCKPNKGKDSIHGASGNHHLFNLWWQSCVAWHCVTGTAVTRPEMMQSRGLSKLFLFWAFFIARYEPTDGSIMYTRDRNQGLVFMWTNDYMTCFRAVQRRFDSNLCQSSSKIVGFSSMELAVCRVAQTEQGRSENGALVLGDYTWRIIPLVSG